MDGIREGRVRQDSAPEQLRLRLVRMAELPRLNLMYNCKYCTGGKESDEEDARHGSGSYSPTYASHKN